MNILILGAKGMIGSHLARVLEKNGATVRRAGREIDFNTMLNPAAWLPHLAGIDVVLNCVGILREPSAGAFERLHHLAPVALFAACEQAGTRRVIQISALGSATDASTGYWRSKGAADADLLLRRLEACVVRLSLVYADDGASSRLFLALATLPALTMPAAHQALVQPVHIDDLTTALAKLALDETPPPRQLALVGPRALSMAAYLAALRKGMQAAAAPVFNQPLPLARLAARVAALHPASPLTPDSLTMLVQSADGGNTADAAPLATLLGYPARDPEHFAGPALRASAVMSWGRPLITLAFALLWLITAAVSWFGWPHEESAAWLAACGIPPVLQEATLLGASLLDGAIGLALLLRPRRWLWPLQLVLVGGYTAFLSICLPEFWLHPFGPLSKNLPLIVVLLVMWRLTEKRK